MASANNKQQPLLAGEGASSASQAQQPRLTKNKVSAVVDVRDSLPPVALPRPAPLLVVSALAGTFPLTLSSGM